MKRLQDVLAAMSDEEAMEVWGVLSMHVENELVDSVEDEPVCFIEGLVDRMTEIIVDLAEP